jgi:hypothetical protein
MHSLMPVIDYLHNLTAVAFIIGCGALRLLTQGTQSASRPMRLFLASAARGLSLMATCSLTGFLAAGAVRVSSGMTTEVMEGLVLLLPVCAGLFFWFSAGRIMRRLKVEK